MGETATMAKRRGRPKSSERDDVTVRVDRRVKIRAEAVADFKGIPLAELLTEILRGPVDREFSRMVRELERDKGGE